MAGGAICINQSEKLKEERQTLAQRLAAVPKVPEAGFQRAEYGEWGRIVAGIILFCDVGLGFNVLVALGC